MMTFHSDEIPWDIAAQSTSKNRFHPEMSFWIVRASDSGTWISRPTSLMTIGGSEEMVMNLALRKNLDRNEIAEVDSGC